MSTELKQWESLPLSHSSRRRRKLLQPMNLPPPAFFSRREPINERLSSRPSLLSQSIVSFQCGAGRQPATSLYGFDSRASSKLMEDVAEYPTWLDDVQCPRLTTLCLLMLLKR
ncbi:hypothetical protein RRG08_031809 [Elysia crispata]|uniref:Uncharacterized protein n=1 Tax=Elysia crispata TaxID=231223 RepID=A0AAE1CTM1_9GAST|nr:hypothetical protein RRG08_031809 [Elysia crispata]